MTDRNEMQAGEPSAWDARYSSGDTPWNKDAALPPLLAHLEGKDTAGTALVIGCGLGHDARAIAALGWQTLGVDFAPLAVAGAIERATSNKSQARFEVADLFNMPEHHLASWDLIAEHTCFAAIPPERRPDYVRATADLLRPGGELVGIFFAHGQEGGPPFNTTPEEIRTLFSPRFDIESIEPATTGWSARKGKELLVVMRRK